MQTTAIEEPIDVKAAAAFLKMPERTVRDKATRGELPSSKPAKRLLFFKSELLAWVKGNGVRATEAPVTN